jgi:hypothetical protein
MLYNCSDRSKSLLLALLLWAKANPHTTLVISDAVNPRKPSFANNKIRSAMTQPAPALE